MNTERFTEIVAAHPDAFVHIELCFVPDKWREHCVLWHDVPGHHLISFAQAKTYKVKTLFRHVNEREALLDSFSLRAFEGHDVSIMRGVMSMFGRENVQLAQDLLDCGMEKIRGSAMWALPRCQWWIFIPADELKAAALAAIKVSE